MKLALTLPLLVISCSSPDPTAGTRREVEANTIGVSYVTIDRSTTDKGRTLVIRGFDAQEREVGSATLFTGKIFNKYDENPFGQWVDGSRLTFTAGGESQPFEAADLRAHSIAEPLSPALASFSRIEAVAAEIEKEAQIRFDRVVLPTTPAATPDKAYYWGCTNSRFPTSAGNPLSCCEFSSPGNESTSDLAFHIPARNPNQISVRSFLNSHAVCRNSDGTTGCTSNCTYGPCGATMATPHGGSNLRIFASYYYAPYGWCGYDTEATGGTDAWPEEYDDPYYGKPMMPGIVATCGCTSCASDGTPMPAGCENLTSCGNTVCENGEDAGSCPQDCGGGSCDGPCDGGYIYNGDCACHNCYEWYNACFSTWLDQCGPALQSCGF